MAITISGSTGIAGVDGSAGTPAIQGTDTNTGIYFPGADRVGITEGGVQVAEFDASGNFQFNSGYGSVATAYGCRAWVNFNGTGTVAIRASGNVTSITDLGVGIFKVNLTTALPDASYAISGFCENNASDRNNLVACTNTSDSASVTAMAAGSFCFKTMTSAATAVDQASTTVAVFR